MAGTFVTQRNLQAAAWGIDGVRLVVAAALLALQFFRKQSDLVAAGFLVFAIREGVMLSGTAATLAESAPSFAAGSALWASALLLTSVPKEFAFWVRAVGMVSSILFAVTSARIFLGRTGIADFLATAVLRLPVSCFDFHRLDLALGEVGVDEELS